MPSKAAAKKEISTNNYIAGVIVGALLIVIICGVIGKSLIGSITINTKVIAGKRTAKSDLDKKLVAIPVLLQNYNQLGTAKDVINHGLPNDPDMPQMVSIMQAISVASGVTLKDVTPVAADSIAVAPVAPAAGTTAATTAPVSTVVAAPTPRTASLNVTILGGYAQIVSFFKNVELSVRPMKVTNTQLTGSDGVLSVNVSLQTYYQEKADIKDGTEAVK